jgi:hypothetical protein
MIKSVNYKINNKVEDFLRDDGFICYALNSSSEADPERESLLRNCFAQANEAEKAKAILTGEDMTYALEPEECEKLKRKIMATITTI